MSRILGMACGLGLAGSALAVDRRVGPNEAYQTVQAGIDAATDGDRVLIMPGTYTEELLVQYKDITVLGDADGVTLQSNGPGTTVLTIDGATVTLDSLVIDGQQQRRSLLVTNGAHVSGIGITLQNGVNADGESGGNLRVWLNAHADLTSSAVIGGQSSGYRPYGGNIGVDYGSSIALGPEVMVQSGSAERGGGLWVEGGCTANVTEAQFQGNSAAGGWNNDGGGLCAEAGSTLVVLASQFEDNHAGMDGSSAGGGIFAGTNAVIDSTLFSAGTAHMGAAVAVENALLQLSSSQVLAHTGDKGAVACVGSPLCVLADSTLEGNSAELGAAFYAYNSESELWSSRFCDNHVAFAGGSADNHGGAVYVAYGRLLLQQTIVSGNSAELDGGGVYATDVIFESVNNHYLGNDAFDTGGALHVANLFGLGSQADSVNDLFLDNTAVVDGGLHFDPALMNNVAWGWFHNNSPSPGTLGVSPTSTQATPPLLTNWALTDRCLYDGMAQAPGSGLIDGGDPLRFDLNGSRSDIGAFGGVGLGDGGLADNDGDGVIDALDCDPLDPTSGLPSQWFPDGDGDGYGADDIWVMDCVSPGPSWTLTGGDCDDSDASVNPTLQWWPDDDGDGLGNPLYTNFRCEQPYGFVDNDGDCDDENAMVLGPVEYFYDADLDGYGTDETFLECFPPVDGADKPGDCDPTDPNVNPGMAEVCNDIDDDCDGVVDNDAVDGVWFEDADGDGFGNPDVRLEGCDPGPGWVADATDCDDTDGRVYPGGKEVWYDGVDGDCDGADDFDQDRDGAVLDDDCDDQDPERHPGAEDAFDDGIDSDCDGVDSRTWVAGGGCACDGQGSAPTGSGSVLLVLGLLGWRRRR